MHLHVIFSSSKLIDVTKLSYFVAMFTLEAEVFTHLRSPLLSISATILKPLGIFGVLQWPSPSFEYAPNAHARYAYAHMSMRACASLAAW